MQRWWQLWGKAEEGAGWFHQEFGQTDEPGHVQDAGHGECQVEGILK